jgi:predicted Zn-dependent protease
VTVRFSRWRRFLLSTCGVTLLATGCGWLGQVVDELRPVRREVARLVSAATVAVDITDDRRLAIAVLDESAKALKPTERREKALEIAKVGYAAYRFRATLAGVDVVFAVAATRLHDGESFAYRSSQLVATSDHADRMPPPPTAITLFLLPIGNVSAMYVDDLAAYIRGRFPISVTVLPPLAVDRAAFDEKRSQIVADELLTSVRREHASLFREPGARLIAITGEDMYTKIKSWTFTFSLGNNLVAVVSYARMDPTVFGNPPDDALVESRLRKMVTKNIGIMCYAKSVSSNPHSVLYGSIGGTDELDVMTEDFDPDRNAMDHR